MPPRVFVLNYENGIFIYYYTMANLLLRTVIRKSILRNTKYEISQDSEL